MQAYGSGTVVIKFYPSVGKFVQFVGQFSDIALHHFVNSQSRTDRDWKEKQKGGKQPPYFSLYVRPHGRHGQFH
jgi:hypothetical protein